MREFWKNSGNNRFYYFYQAWSRLKLFFDLVILGKCMSQVRAHLGMTTSWLAKKHFEVIDAWRKLYFSSLHSVSYKMWFRLLRKMKFGKGNLCTFLNPKILYKLFVGPDFRIGLNAAQKDNLLGITLYERDLITWNLPVIYGSHCSLRKRQNYVF